MITNVTDSLKRQEPQAAINTLVDATDGFWGYKKERNSDGVEFQYRVTPTSAELVYVQRVGSATVKLPIFRFRSSVAVYTKYSSGGAVSKTFTGSQLELACVAGDVVVIKSFWG